MKRIFFGFFVLFAFALSGCTRIETGATGILKHWGGEISTEPQQGFNWTIFDTIYAVDATQTRVIIPDLRPADSNGVLLDKLDVQVTYQLNPAKVPAFYIQTKELDRYTDPSGTEVQTVGLNLLESIVKHAVQEQTKKQSLVTLSANLSDYEASILKQTQDELQKGYPDVFQVLRVNVNHFEPPSVIRDQANRTASLRSEAERNAEEQKLIPQRTLLETSKALIEAQALKQAMDDTHLSAEQLIAWKNARAYETMAHSFTDKPQTVLTVPAAAPTTK